MFPGALVETRLKSIAAENRLDTAKQRLFFGLQILVAALSTLSLGAAVARIELRKFVAC